MNFFGFDPSKMDQKTLLKLSELVNSLPREQLMKMQTLTHNMMAGFDIRKEAEEFERSLPPEFRSKLMALMAEAQSAAPGVSDGPRPMGIQAEPAGPVDLPGDVREARLTVLRAVADGKMSPEEADQLLFPE